MSRRTIEFLLCVVFVVVVWIELDEPSKNKAIQTIKDLFRGSFASENAASPKTGELLAGYTVTSPWGPRTPGIAGASSFHKGVDLGTPIGTPLYAIGQPGEIVVVRCWRDIKGGGLVASYKVRSQNLAFDYLHLSRCASGIQLAGSVIAKSGASGICQGPHFHLTQRRGTGQKMPPHRRFAIWALTGRQPFSLF